MTKTTAAATIMGETKGTRTTFTVRVYGVFTACVGLAQDYMARFRVTFAACLAATAAALSLGRQTSFPLQRSRKVVAQNYYPQDDYYGEQTGAPQTSWDTPQPWYEPPPPQGAQQQRFGAPVLWHMTPITGAYSEYAVSNGGEQIMGRFDMLEQKLTVSRAQCVVQVLPDGTATISSLGKRPTGLRRHQHAPWYGLSTGQHVLLDGEQIALDMDSGESYGWQGQPYTAIFTCRKEGGDVGVGEAPHGPLQLPHPWVQQMDPNGNAFYLNQQTGVATWDPRVPHYPTSGYDAQ